MRLRQICLVADKLAPVIDDLRSVMGLGAGYHDKGVESFGLENEVIPIGDNFLEVVAPTQSGTTAGRYMDRRGGNGGYMVIMQCGDGPKMRERLLGMGVRVALHSDREQFQITQYHPADCGGTLMEIDSVGASPEKRNEYGEPMADWTPAGPDWQQHVSTGIVTALVGADMQSNNPGAIAELWSKHLDLPVQTSASGEPYVQLINAKIRFTEEKDDRGWGLGGIDIKVADRDALFANADARNIQHSDDQFMICGTRINIVK